MNKDVYRTSDERYDDQVQRDSRIRILVKKVLTRMGNTPVYDDERQQL